MEEPTRARLTGAARLLVPLCASIRPRDTPCRLWLVKWIAENLTELLGLLASLALLLVTLIYTKATREMARTAARAAEDSQKATAAAERSAEAALDAARVAQSQIEVEFEGRLISLGNARGTQHVPTVEIRSVADAVVVSRVVIRRAFRKLAGETHTLEGEASVTNEDLIPVGETQLPRRVHKEERLHFTHPAMPIEGVEPLVRFILDVHYTFSEDGGAGGQRQVIVSAKGF